MSLWKARCFPLRTSVLSCSELIRRLHLFFLIAVLLLGLSPAAEEKRLGVYSPQTSFTIPIVDHDGREYVGLIDLLDPFGRASLTRDGKRWRVKLEMSNGSKVDGEFSENSTQGKLRGKKITLNGAFWVENSRGYIPLSSAQTVLSQLLGMSSALRDSHRLFLGDVGTTYTSDLQKGNPSKLVLHFSAPVNPTISTEPGRVRLTFNRDALLAGPNSPVLDDPSIHSLSFAESNGVAELTVTTSAPVSASFADANKTIALTGAVQTSAQAGKPPTPTAPASGASQTPLSTPSTGSTLPSPARPAAPRFIVVIDPAHGGDDPGAALGNGLFEKDVTLALSRRIRTALEQRSIAAVLLREGDSNLTLEQRAIAANSYASGFYVAVHAATMGSGVRLYSARLSSTSVSKAGFLPWDTAQAAYLEQSHNLTASLITEFDSRQIRAIPLEAALKPLRNVAKPATVVEIAPQDGTPDSLASANYQQSIAVAVAAAVANLRGAMQGGQ